MSQSLVALERPRRRHRTDSPKRPHLLRLLRYAPPAGRRRATFKR